MSVVHSFIDASVGFFSLIGNVALFVVLAGALLFIGFYFDRIARFGIAIFVAPFMMLWEKLAHARDKKKQPSGSSKPPL